MRPQLLCGKDNRAGFFGENTFAGPPGVVTLIATAVTHIEYSLKSICECPNIGSRSIDNSLGVNDD
jgi:hypothetical protein